jgi:hypothetical protein
MLNGMRVAGIRSGSRLVFKRRIVKPVKTGSAGGGFLGTHSQLRTLGDPPLDRGG